MTNGSLHAFLNELLLNRKDAIDRKRINKPLLVTRIGLPLMEMDNRTGKSFSSSKNNNLTKQQFQNDPFSISSLLLPLNSSSSSSHSVDSFDLDHNHQLDALVGKYKEEWDKMFIIDKLSILEIWHKIIKKLSPFCFSSLSSSHSHSSSFAIGIDTFSTNKEIDSNIIILNDLNEKIFIPWITRVYPKSFHHLVPNLGKRGKFSSPSIYSPFSSLSLSPSHHDNAFKDDSNDNDHDNFYINSNNNNNNTFHSFSITTIAYNEKRDSRDNSVSPDLYANRQKLQDLFLSYLGSKKESSSFHSQNSSTFPPPLSSSSSFSSNNFRSHNHSSSQSSDHFLISIKSLYRMENSKWFANLLIQYFEHNNQRNKMDLLEARITTSMSSQDTLSNSIINLIVKLDIFSLYMALHERLCSLLEESLPYPPLKKSASWIKLFGHLIMLHGKSLLSLDSFHSSPFLLQNIEWFKGLINKKRLKDNLAWLKLIILIILEGEEGKDKGGEEGKRGKGEKLQEKKREIKEMWISSLASSFLSLDLEELDLCSLLMLIEFYGDSHFNFNKDKEKEKDVIITLPVDAEYYLLSFSDIFNRFILNLKREEIEDGGEWENNGNGNKNNNASGKLIITKIKSTCTLLESSSSTSISNIAPISLSNVDNSDFNINDSHDNSIIEERKGKTSKCLIINENDKNLQFELRKWFWWQWTDLREILLTLLEYWNREKIVNIKDNLVGCIPFIIPEILKGHEKFIMGLALEIYHEKYNEMKNNV